MSSPDIEAPAPSGSTRLSSVANEPTVELDTVQLETPTSTNRATVEDKQRSITNKMLLSHFLTRIGSQSWEFIIPLILIAIAPNTLVPAALYGLTTTLARVLFGASIGKQIDRRGRLEVIRLGVLFQALAVAFSGFVLAVLLDHSTPEMASNIFISTKSLFLMILLLFSASIEALAAMSMDISVERDWVPTAVTTEAFLTIMNTRMRQIDLVTEVVGPFAAGLVMVIPGVTPLMALIIVAVFDVLTFLPQYILLAAVHDEVASLRKPKEPPQPIEEDLSKPAFIRWLLSDWNPIANLYKCWGLFVEQPIALLVISFSLLWLTILSPHSVVLTAYLNSRNYTTAELGVFRGLGAVLGIGGTFAFPWFARKFGVQRAAAFYIAEEAFAVLIAAFTFSWEYSGTNYLVYSMRFIFMFFLLLSRCGLYGFEVGEIQMVQLGIPEKIRGQVNSVESSLTSVASLSVFIITLLLSDPAQFVYLVWGSCAAILLACATYNFWCFKWQLTTEKHSHTDDTHKGPTHLHFEGITPPLDNEGSHEHSHYHKRF